MKRFLRIAATLPMLAGATILSAQLPTVDITIHTTMNDQLEIYVRPDGPFDEVFSSSVFTIRWFNADGVNLGGVQQTSPVNLYQGVIKSGPEQVSGPFRYQILTGFGLITLEDMETSWAPFEEVLLCRLNILNGSSYFELTNDEWAQVNNGSYYISLNGEDRTGVIYSFTTVHEEAFGTSVPAVRIMPNPGNGQFQALLHGMGDQRVEMEVTDGLGKVVWIGRPMGGHGTARTEIDMLGHPAGMYLLTVRTPERSSTHRLVIAGQ